MKTIDEYTIYCTEEQTRKAFELGALIEIVDCEVWLDDRLCGCGKGAPYEIPHMTDYLYEDGERVESLMLIEGTDEYGDMVCHKPTAEQMLGWLGDQYIDCFVGKQLNHRFVATVCVNDDLIYSNPCNSRKNATLDAIGAALDYLIKNKK